MSAASMAQLALPALGGEGAPSGAAGAAGVVAAGAAAAAAGGASGGAAGAAAPSGGIGEEEAMTQKVLHTIRKKLEGTDYSESSGGEPLSVPAQLRRVMEDAQNSSKWAVMYVGWQAFL